MPQLRHPLPRFLLLCAATPAEALKGEWGWAAWKERYGRTYDAAEDAAREAVFAANERGAAAQSAANPRATYGPGPFAALTTSEFAAERLRPYRIGAPAAGTGSATAPVPPPPASIDWRARGAVTPVVDQGQLGSPWAYPVADTVAAQWFLRGHPLQTLSYDQLAQCANVSARLGTPAEAFAYVKRAGLETAAYFASHPSCTPQGPEAHIKGFRTLARNESAMLDWLIRTGPFVVGVDASHWQIYTGGVLKGCSGRGIDHYALVVGGGADYWLLKNSWGPEWGEEGYVRVAFGDDECGIAELATGAWA